MKRIIIALALLITLPLSSVKADENPLGITLFGPFLYSNKVPNKLFLLSEIGDGDSWELRRALRTHDVDTVVLASDGGSVAEGLRMAGVIFDKQMTTYIPNLFGANGCYSACAYMFFAGRNRLADGQLGVHQIGYYGDKAAENTKRKQGEILEDAQYTTSEVIGFLNEFETPPWVYERMFRSKEMYIFTASEKIDLSSGEIPEITKQKVNDFLNQLSKHLETLDGEQTQEPVVLAFDTKDQERIKAFQTLLNQAKCVAGTADGIWGRKTNTAALRFAKANDLPYMNYKSIDLAYIKHLTSEVRSDCPPAPKPKKNTTLAGRWAFDLSCRNGAVKGWAQITFNYKQSSTNSSWYRVNYTNNLKQNFQGLASNNNGSFNFSLNQTNGSYHTKGSGRVSADKRTLQGLTEAGCAFQARRS